MIMYLTQEQAWLIALYKEFTYWKAMLIYNLDGKREEFPLCLQNEVQAIENALTERKVI